MRNTKIFIGILILMIAFLAWVRFGNRENLDQAAKVEEKEEVTLSPTPLPSEAPWEIFTTKFFTLSYPTIASASARSGGPDSLTWAVTYMGEVQKKSGRTQTELFDGYAITIDRFEVVGDKAAENQANSDRESTINACDTASVTDIVETTFRDFPAYQFTGGCMGVAELTYFQDGSSLYRISNFVTSTTDQDSKLYKETTKRILSSFSLLPN